MSWVRALFTIGARQMMACPSFTKLPMEMNFKPVSDSIGKMTPPTTLGFSVEPSITGIEEPWTSASKISAGLPARSGAAARLTATVLLPTPPLPETTAMMRVFDSSRNAGASSDGPPCRLVIRFCRSSSVITPKSTSTLWTPSIIMTRSRTSVVMRCFIGHPAVVSATPTVTPAPSGAHPEAALDALAALDHQDPVAHVGRDAVLHRAPGRGERAPDGDARALDVYIPDHVQGDEAAAERRAP